MINVLELGRQTVPQPFGGGGADSGVVSCLLRKLVGPGDVRRLRLWEERAAPSSTAPVYAPLDHCDERHDQSCAVASDCQARVRVSQFETNRHRLAGVCISSC